MRLFFTLGFKLSVLKSNTFLMKFLSAILLLIYAQTGVELKVFVITNTTASIVN